MESQPYSIQTDFFEGPLDLLLHLIKKKKMSITEVRISEITSEYLEYLTANRGINPSREGDFLITASTLIYIKSRSLLPKTDSGDEETPEKKLINTLIEYDKIQKISKILKTMEARELLLWKREEVEENFESREFDIEEVSSFQLAEVFMNIVKKKDKEQVLVIESKNYSIEKKWQEIEGLVKENGFLNFSEYIQALDSIEEILVSFFTLLEMIKQKILIAVQKKIFDTISVWKRDKEEAAQ